MSGQTPDVENGPQPIWERQDLVGRTIRRYFNIWGIDLDILSKLRRRPPGGYTSYATTKNLQDTTHHNFRGAVLHNTEKEVMVDLATLQRIKILHLCQRLLEIAYDYRYAKRSMLKGEDFTGVTDAQDIDAQHSDTDETLRNGINATETEDLEAPVDALDNDAPIFSNVLKEYTEAVRDWQFMKEFWSNNSRENPFHLSTNQQPNFDMIQSAHDTFAHRVNKTAQHKDLTDILFGDYHDKPEFPGGSPPRWNGAAVRAANLDAVWGLVKLRLELMGMAFLGGSFLIVPMFIMVLINTTMVSLVTTTAFVMGFGNVLSLYLDKKFDVLSGTAAYAAGGVCGSYFGG